MPFALSWWGKASRCRGPGVRTKWTGARVEMLTSSLCRETRQSDRGWSSGDSKCEVPDSKWWSEPDDQNLVRDRSNKGRFVQRNCQIDAQEIHSERSDPWCGSGDRRTSTHLKTAFGHEASDGERESGFHPSGVRWLETRQDWLELAESFEPAHASWIETVCSVPGLHGWSSWPASLLWRLWPESRCEDCECLQVPSTSRAPKLHSSWWRRFRCRLRPDLESPWFQERSWLGWRTASKHLGENAGETDLSSLHVHRKDWILAPIWSGSCFSRECQPFRNQPHTCFVPCRRLRHTEYKTWCWTELWLAW